jgi:hypothetical protein
MTPEARAARERKQKIFVVVGGLFVLAMLAIQLPKILGGSSDSEAAPATSPSVTTPGASSGATPPAGTPTSLDGQPGLPTLESSKLRSFSVFSKKDPFVQQVVTASEAPASGSTASGGKEQAKKADEKAPTKEFTTGQQPAAAAVTVIRVNGSPETLQTGSAFPSTDPVFVLVAEQPKQKTVTIGIAGGAYANGSKTIKLKVGKPLVLENTATGAKYKLVLVSVGSGAPTTPSTPSTEAPTPPETP